MANSSAPLRDSSEPLRERLTALMDAIEKLTALMPSLLLRLLALIHVGL